MNKKLIFSIGLSFGIMVVLPCQAESLSLDLGNNDGSFTGRLVQLLILLTVLTLAPSILIMMTSFTRIIVVLSFLRTALGTQTTPPNVVLISLSLFLTFFIMSPVFETVYNESVKPLVNNDIDEAEALQRAKGPLGQFMAKHTRDEDLQLFTAASGETNVQDKDIPFKILVPAFMVSELRKAFEIGFMIFLPFLIIDMVVASVLMAMGMMMLPPVLISLPFKLIFFVLVDGWHLLVGSLMKSFI